MLSELKLLKEVKVRILRTHTYIILSNGLSGKNNNLEPSGKN